MTSDPAALADSILRNAEPAIARDYVSLVLGSDDPEDKRKFFELRAKQRNAEKEAFSGTVLNVTFDFSGSGLVVNAEAAPAAEAIEADDARPAEALPAPEPEVDLSMFDLSDMIDEQP